MRTVDNRTIFERVKDLNLPFGRYVVVGGAMEAHGIRKARDIDLVVDAVVFSDLRSRGWTPYRPKPKFMGRTWDRLEKDGAQVNSELSWAGHVFASADELIEKAEIIEGVPFAPLNLLLEWKQVRGREKDRVDVMLIQNYIEETNG